MAGPAVFLTGSMRATDPVAVSSHRAFPSVARDWIPGVATLPVGTMGVAGKGDGDGVGGNGENGIGVGEGFAVGDGVAIGLGPGPKPEPPPKTPNPRTPTSSAAAAAIDSRVRRRGWRDGRARRCHG